MRNYEYQNFQLVVFTTQIDAPDYKSLEDFCSLLSPLPPGWPLAGNIAGRQSETSVLDQKIRLFSRCRNVPADLNKVASNVMDAATSLSGAGVADKVPTSSLQQAG